MHDDNHHSQLIKGFFEQQRQIFDSSTQAIYAFLDEGHIVCNDKFAQLLGYATPAEWAAADDNFTAAFVAPASQSTLVRAFQNAMQNLEGATVNVTWNTKQGESLDTSVTIVPSMYEDHAIAIHFVTKAG